MSRYGQWERQLARAMRRMPHLKRQVKYFYQCINYLMYRKPYASDALTSFRAINNSPAESFFGYYDRSPENQRGNVLFHRTKGEGADSVEIVVQESGGEIKFVAETNIYNWQQGARALWIGDRFVFNRWNPAQSVVQAVIQSLDGSRIALNAAVQDVFGENYLLGINYSRVSALQPEYGYNGLGLEDLDEVRADGIWKTDIASGETRLLYSLERARELDANWSNARLDLFNHVMISPDGSRFLVLHRWYENGVRCERLLLGASDGSELRILVDAGMVSHCAWADDQTVLGYMRAGDGHEGYWLVDVSSGEARLFGDGSLDKYGDGHPSVFADWFVTDTYPNKSAQQTLLMGNWKTGTWKVLGEFFHPLTLSGSNRCDLHPRWAPDGERIYFDSAHTGKRALYVMELEPHCFPSS